MLTEEAEVSGIACWRGYGMTETASTMAAERANAQMSVGQVLAGGGSVALWAMACSDW